MVDIPKLIRAKAKQNAIRRLEEVRIALATNNRASEDEDFKSLMNGLTRTAGIENTNHFDREKFEQLRMMQAAFRKEHSEGGYRWRNKHDSISWRCRND